jgi:hypothetical protein
MKKNFENKKKYFLVSCQPMVGNAESGSVSQRYGYADPDPYQNITDPQH